jgi:hypothetical protein
MSAYRHNRRDELTQRIARSVRDTITDPYDYSEGPAEPQYITDERDIADRLLVRWGPLAIVALVVMISLGVL